MKLKFSRQIFEKSIDIKLNENPSIGSHVVPCERTDITKLVVAFRNFANAPKNEIKWNANLMQIGNFIDVFLARHVSGTYAHHQEH